MQIDRLKTLIDYYPLTGIFWWKISTGGVSAGMIAGTRHHHGCINRVNSDNRFSNLREATNKQNQRNRIYKEGVGVRFNKTEQKWKVCVCGKHLGTFDTYAKALEISKKAWAEYCPEFAPTEGAEADDRKRTEQPETFKLAGLLGGI